AFTIHDREDSADLMNLVRHELGFSKTERRFPMKGTCLAIYSRCVNAETPIEEVLGTSFPWCASWAAELKQLFASYVEAKQRQNVLDYDDLLLYWAQTVSDPALADDIGERFDQNWWSERTSGERPALVGVAEEAAQAGFIVERVLENREAGAALKEQAVLFRASHHSGPLEVELTRRHIPFVKFGGLKFLH